MAESAELKVKRSQNVLLLISRLFELFFTAYWRSGLVYLQEAACQMALKRSSYICGSFEGWRHVVIVVMFRPDCVN